jgi:adenylate cyclase
MIGDKRENDQRNESRVTATRRGPCADLNPCGDEGRVKRAFLAAKRSEMLAPVHAIIDVARRVLAEIEEPQPSQFAADLKKIADAGNALLGMVDEVLGPSATSQSDDDLRRVRSRMRHDMRNMLNAVINYSEMWLEEAAEHFLEAFVPDLQMIHDSGRRCLRLIDAILASWNDPESASSTFDSVVIKETVRKLLEQPDQVRAVDQQCGRVLVADDNETNRDIVRRRLEVQGHCVSLAANGAQALEMIECEQPDVVLLDIIMPEMNGFDVLRHLKANPQTRELPVIMISSLDELDIVVRCIEMGAEDFLPKPFNPVLLQARIGACLEKKRLREREVCYLRQIEQEKRRADELLQVILPAEIVAELKLNNCVRPRRHENVAVLFADIVNFTPYCEQHSPEHVLTYLQKLVEMWEESAQRHGVEKIKTVGDAFMAVSGLLKEAENPVLNCVRCGMEMIAATQSLPTGWNLRIGIHCGQVVAGVLGRRTYLFDLWGDTVNTAARMESHGVQGAITLSAAAWQTIENSCRGTSMGCVTVKGKGSLEMVRFEGFETAKELQPR